jgi:hypothetical protein
VSAEDAKWFYDAVEKDESSFVVGFEDLWHQVGGSLMYAAARSAARADAVNAVSGFSFFSHT